MSFEIKYDRDRNPILPKEAPAFVEEAKKIHEQQQEVVAPVEALADIPEEVQEPESVQIDQSTTESAHAAAEITPPVEEPKESNKERNMRVLREKAERIERERNEAIKRIQQLEHEKLLESYRQQQTQPKVEQAYEDIRVAPDDLLEGKHLSPIQKELKDLKQAMLQQQQQNATTLAAARLRAQFPDFDKVVSKDNIALLEELEPEIAQSINSNPDLYTTGTSAYKIIKQLGIHVEDVYQVDKDKAQKNAAKPKSIATISPQRGESPLTQANAFAQGLTPELQKQLRAEMEAARRSM